MFPFMKKALGITGIILALAVTVFLLRPRTVRAQSGCTVGALAGSYGFNIQGDYYYVNRQGVTNHAFFAGSGLMFFDGGGNIGGSDTFSDDANIVQGNLSGSYGVNRDCTGSMFFTDAANNETFNANFTIVNGGREVDFISTGTGDIITGTAKLQ